MHSLTIHVYPTDCDMLGHVNHATMITFLEHARWALVEPAMPARDFLRGGVWSVVRHVDIGYHAQSTPGEDLVIRSGLLSVGRTSFVIRQDVRKLGAGDANVLVADAKITFVCVGTEGRPVSVPDEWRRIFPQWTEEAA
jgi:YbgC/YbaW family acyl-CoA thioester hydrolase